MTEGDPAEPLYRQANYALERTRVRWSLPAPISVTASGLFAENGGRKMDAQLMDVDSYSTITFPRKSG